MIPAGYMYKLAGFPPQHLTVEGVSDICSVGACSGSNAPYFVEYIKYWKHNGYWFFNSPAVMRKLAKEHDIDLSSMTLFYYELYESEFDKANVPNSHEEESWSLVECDRSSPTDVVIPVHKELIGYDVVEYVSGCAAECSLLSCSNVAAKFNVNSHCLFDSFEFAKEAVESGAFHEVEPGPYRIIAVYIVRDIPR
jgi:hypothetical protein